jgi:DNA-binding transcriptional LysR family regulator
LIEFQHLTYFVAVAEEGSIRAAAQRLHLTQPPLSRHMRTLEERVGVQLLTRTPRGVLLTPAGEVLLAESREILTKLRHSLERVHQAAEGERRIRFGYVGSAGADLIPGLIAGLARLTPPIDVELVELPYVRPLVAFAKLDCDAGFVRRFLGGSECDGANGNVHLEALRRDRTVLVVPAGHPLADAGQVGLPALDGEDMIVVAGSTDMIAMTAAAHGITIRSVTEAPTVPAVVGLIAAGRGIGWMAATTPVLHRHDVVSVPVTGYTSPVAIVWAVGLAADIRDSIRAVAVAVAGGADPEPQAAWANGSGRDASTAAIAQR